MEIIKENPQSSTILWRAVREIARDAPEELADDLEALEAHLWHQLSEQVLQSISGLGPEVTAEVSRKLVDCPA